jgi:hypothetical protein
MVVEGKGDERLNEGAPGTECAGLKRIFDRVWAVMDKRTYSTWKVLPVLRRYCLFLPALPVAGWVGKAVGKRCPYDDVKARYLLRLAK